MTRNILNYIIFFIFISPIEVIAQQSCAVVKYESYQKIDLKLDSTKFNEDIRSEVQKIFEKQFHKTFILEINKQESIYYEIEKITLNTQTVSLDILYKNFTEQQYTHKKDFLDKIFLIEDDLKKYNWVLEKEQKKIGLYNCFRAILNIKDLNDKDHLIQAWYTPDIPISNGPSNYHGLPGLILEVNYGTNTVLCTEIIQNSKEEIIIKKPRGGEKISQLGFDKIEYKKNEEGLSRGKQFLQELESHKINKN